MFQKNKSPMSNRETMLLIKKILVWIKGLPKSIYEAKLSHNTGTKMLSLALAILFWFFVMDQVDPEITRVIESVPVQLTNTQELDQNNLKIMNQTDFFVNVEVTGRRNNVLGLNAKSIYLWADMRSVRGGVNNVFINSSINSESVSIKSVLPKEIVITVDRVVSLPKPVQIIISDSFQESLFQESLEVNPIEIKVTGPESLVNSVSYLGGTISVAALSGDHTREVSLVPYSFDGEVVNGVTLELSYATLNLKVGKTKLIPVEANVEGSPKSGYQLTGINIKPETVTVSGQLEVIEALNSISVEGIELNGDEEGTFIVEKELRLPEGVKAVGLNTPVQIELVIEEVQTKEFIFDVNEIPIVNLGNQFTTNLADNLGTVVVRVTDVASVIEGLTKSEIHLDLNMSNIIEPGSYRLNINMANRENYSEVSLTPEMVDVEVTLKGSETNP
ncbi:MAG: hypothetical protein LCH34_14000 [Firmicutes bacterium]|nr:hypothetical protein [Bacillota bacterium]